MFTSIQVRRSVSFLSKLGVAMMLGFFSIAPALASENISKDSVSSTENSIPVYSLDFSDLKQVPTITFVDKNLHIVAEFYGEVSEIKTRFPETFADASLLGEFTNHKIYLVTPSKK
ncbi:MAG: hypothetical protein PSV36_01365 [Algoriphagus sp.]|nr:hypothetical protein [Algoriphagus sp.]